MASRKRKAVGIWRIGRPKIPTSKLLMSFASFRRRDFAVLKSIGERDLSQSTAGSKHDADYQDPCTGVVLSRTSSRFRERFRVLESLSRRFRSNLNNLTIGPSVATGRTEEIEMKRSMLAAASV